MSQTAIRAPDGSVQYVDNEQLPQAVAAGGQVPAGTSVRVTLPDATGGPGAQTEVPWEQYQEMLRHPQGATLTPQANIDAQGHLSDLESTTSGPGAFGRGLLHELSFGAYSPSDDQRLADDTYHPVGTGFGKAAGFALPFAFTGPLGAGAKAAGATAEYARASAEIAADMLVDELAGRIPGNVAANVPAAAANASSWSNAARGAGRVATAADAAAQTSKVVDTAREDGAPVSALSRVRDGLGEVLRYHPSNVISRMGGGIIDGMGGELVGHVVGGMAEGAGYQTLRGVLDKDVPLSGESIASAALLGGLFGAGGYGLSKVASRFSTATDELVDRLARGGQHVDSEELVERLNSNRDLTPRQLSRSAEGLGSDVRANLEGDVAMQAAGREAIRDAASLERQLKAFRGSPFSGLRNDPAATLAINNGLTSAGLLRRFASQPEHIQSQIMASYGNHLHDLDAAVMAARQAGMDVSELPARFMPQNIAARQTALEALSAGPQGLAQAASPAEVAAQRLAVRLTAGTQRATQAPGIASSLLSRIPIVGKTLGRLASDHPIASAIALQHLIPGALGHLIEGGVVARGAAKLINKLYESPARGLNSSVLASQAISRLGLGSGDSTKPERLVSDIRRMTPERAQQLTVQASAKLGGVHPDVVQAAGAGAAKWVTTLQGRLDTIVPPRTGTRALGAQDLSSDQVRQLHTLITSAADPTHFARLLHDGSLTQADLQLATELWPAHVTEAKRLAMDWLTRRDPTTVSRADIAKLETLLGPDLVGSRVADSGRAAQASISTMNSAIKPTGAPAPPGKSAASDLAPPAQAAVTRPGT